jgi:hypothetical protein
MCKTGRRCYPRRQPALQNTIKICIVRPALILHKIEAVYTFRQTTVTAIPVLAIFALSTTFDVVVRFCLVLIGPTNALIA